MSVWNSNLPPSIDKAFDQLISSIKPPLQTTAFSEELDEIKESAKMSLMALIRAHLDAQNLKIEQQLKITDADIDKQQITQQATVYVRNQFKKAHNSETNALIIGAVSLIQQQQGSAIRTFLDEENRAAAAGLAIALQQQRSRSSHR